MRPLRLARGGYDVTINYSRSHERAEQTLDELRAIGGEHRAVQADVADDAAVRDLVAAATPSGRLDVLVNNAGTTSETPPREMAHSEILVIDGEFTATT